MAKFGIATVPATGSTTIASGYVGSTEVQLVAHPSNAGIVYVKNNNDTAIGYPLSAGATLNLKGSNLGDLVASGVVGARVAYAYSQ